MAAWRRTSATVFCLALLTRCFGVAVTTLTDLNSYAQADAGQFAATAARTATTLAAGSIPPIAVRQVYPVWGLFLSPFWFVPGPSRVYARVAVALLGAYAVYNVFRITAAYASEQAAVIAAGPMVLFPTFVFIHGTVLREAAVLFGLTTAFRLALVREGRLGPLGRAVAIGGCLLFALLLRVENLPLYLLVVAAGGLVWFARRFGRRAAIAAGVPVASAGAVLALPVVQALVARLATIRARRAKGRTVYLGSTIPDRLSEVVAFSGIAAAYFLFTPFPWMVGRPIDLVALGQALVNLAFFGFALRGSRVLLGRWPPALLAAAVAWLLFGAAMYGVGTANVGTAVRHRQMFTWVLFVLGGVGVSQYVRFEWRAQAR